MTNASPYLAIVPVEGTDVLALGDFLAAAQRQWSRLGKRGFLPASALELSQLADLGPCWVIRVPVAASSAAVLPPPSPVDVARAVAQADRTPRRPQAPPRTRPSGPRLAYTSGGGR